MSSTHPAKITTSEEITEAVIASMEEAPDERLKGVMRSLVRHVHDFAREVEIRPSELLRAARFLTDCGQISSESRHEFLLLWDTLGLTMVVDTLAADAGDGASESSVLGPFYRDRAPWIDHGESLSRGDDDGERVHFYGRVLDVAGRPLGGALLDIWGTNAAGLYENIDPSQPDMNLRGRLRTRNDGTFEVWTAKPVSYPVPADGPAGALLHALARHNMRPAHIHVIVSAPGHQAIVSELFTSDDPYLESDAVFGVKPSLVVDYVRRDETWSLKYDFVLAPGEGEHISFSSSASQDTE